LSAQVTLDSIHLTLLFLSTSSISTAQQFQDRLNALRLGFSFADGLAKPKKVTAFEGKIISGIFPIAVASDSYFALFLGFPFSLFQEKMSLFPLR
jgi:hypothetical protein